MYRLHTKAVGGERFLARSSKLLLIYTCIMGTALSIYFSAGQQAFLTNSGERHDRTTDTWGGLWLAVPGNVVWYVRANVCIAEKK